MWNMRGKVKDVSKIFSLSNQKEEVATYRGAEDHSGGSPLSTFKDSCSAGTNAITKFLIWPILYKRGYTRAPNYIEVPAELFWTLCLCDQQIKFQMAGPAKKNPEDPKAFVIK